MPSSDLRRHPQPSFFSALPAYLGGKRRLCPLIFSLIAEQVPRREWPDSTLLDPFSGGGAIALYAKAQGFRVVASDLAARAAIVARALVANSSTRINREDVLDLFREPDGASYPRAVAGHAPEVFTTQQADWLDRARARAQRRSEPTRSLLLLVVIKVALRCQPMSMLTATDARHAAAGDFDRVSPRRLGHYLRAQQGLLTVDAVWRLAEDVNAGVFGGRGEARYGDAREVITDAGADVLYLDPPYPGTSRYEREYAALDAALGDAPTERPPPTIERLLDAAGEIPLVVHGGPTVTLDDLVESVGAHREVVRAVAVPYPHLRSIASKEKNDANREFIVLARR